LINTQLYCKNSSLKQLPYREKMEQKVNRGEKYCPTAGILGQEATNI